MLTSPRYLWFGRGKWIYTPDDESLQSLLKYFTKVPAYISSYIFPTKHTIIFDRIIFDIDHPTDLSIPYKAVENLSNFCDEHGIPNEIVFSGGHGFHFYVYFKPTKDIDRYKLLAIQTSLLIKNGIGLRDSDTKYPIMVSTVLGKFKQVFRVPNSKYVYLKTFEENGHYCRWISKEDFKKGIDYVTYISKKPSDYIPTLSSNFSFSDIVDILFDEEIAVSPDYYRGRKDIKRNNGNIPKLEYLPNCIRNFITGGEPSHLIRLESTAYLKFLKYSDEAIFKLFKGLNWRDFDERMTRYQITTINPRLPACRKIRQVYGDRFCKGCILSMSD